MKLKFIITVAVLYMVGSPIFSNDVENKIILNSMEFPEPDLSIGDRLNDPLFAVKIQKKNTDNNEIKKTILKLEKELSDKSDPSKIYELANYYKETSDCEKAINYYRKFLESGKGNAEDYKDILIKGDLYYSLSEIDLKTEKIDNLEKALFFLTKAVELNQEDLLQWIKLGDCYLSLEKTTEALYCYNKVLEKKLNDFSIYTRLQAASFQRDYLKLSDSRPSEKIENQKITEGFNFDYLQIAIDNSPADFKDSIKLQHYVYLMRLMLLKSELYVKNNQNIPLSFNTVFTKDEKIIIDEAANLVKSMRSKDIKNIDLIYLSGIINYLKSDYEKAISVFEEILKKEMNSELIYNDILFINFYHIKDNSGLKSLIGEILKLKPAPESYLILACIEFRNNELTKAEMLCKQSLKINESYPEAYSAIAVISALNGNYIEADEMIKKGNLLIQKTNSKESRLSSEMKVNEAAIALLKKENERAYILLQSVRSVDNNVKASLLYNRYFKKK